MLSMILMCRGGILQYWWTESPVKVSVLLLEKETCKDCSRNYSAECSVQRERSKGSRGGSGNVAKATADHERQG